MSSFAPNYLIWLLLLVAIVLGASTVLSVRGVSWKSGLTQGLGSLLWASPVIAVVAFVAVKVMPHFQFGATPGNSSTAAPSWLDTDDGPLNVEDVESFPIETVDVSHGGVPAKENIVPAWTKSKVQRLEATKNDPQKTVWRVVTEGRWENSIEEARAAVLDEAANLVREDFSQYYPGGSAAPSDVIREHAFRAEFIEQQTHEDVSRPFTMYKVYWQVELSPEVREQLSDSWKEEVGARRAWLLGGVFALFTLIAGTFAAYFHLDKKSKGAHRFRLKLAATALMTAGALGMLATMSHHV
jgi:hypothetical protein